MSNIVIVSGESNKSLAASIANKLDCLFCPIILDHYPSGESQIELKCHLHGASVYIVQSDGLNPGELVMQTAMLADACHQASAKRISLILPSLPFTNVDEGDEKGDFNIDKFDPLARWMKQAIFPSSTSNFSPTEIYNQIDAHQRRFHTAKVPIYRSNGSEAFKLSARLMMNGAARIESVISFSLPRPQLAGYFKVPLIDLPLHPLLKSNLNSSTKTIIAVSDLASSRLAGRVASALNWPFLVLHRISKNEQFNLAGNSNSDSNIDDVLLIEEREHFCLKRCIDAANFLRNLKRRRINLFMPHHSQDLHFDIITDHFDHIYLTNSMAIPQNIIGSAKVSIMDLSSSLVEMIKLIEDPEEH